MRPGSALHSKAMASFQLLWHAPKDGSNFCSCRFVCVYSASNVTCVCTRELGAGLGGGYPVPQRSLSQNHRLGPLGICQVPLVHSTASSDRASLCTIDQHLCAKAFEYFWLQSLQHNCSFLCEIVTFDIC